MEELDLMEMIRILWRRRWLILGLTLAAGIASYTASKLSTPIYEAKTKILVLDKTAGGLSIVSELGGMPKNQVSNYVEILKSRSLLQVVTERLDLPADEEHFNKFQRRLTVQPIQGTDTIEIRVQHEDRHQAQRIANTLVTCFLERNLRDNQEDARQARQFIEEQLQVVGERLRRSEAALVAYQKTARIITPTEEISQAVEKLSEFEANRASLEVSLASARARLAKIEEALSGEERTLISAKVLARNPVFERYRQEITDLQAELAAALAEYTEKHPKVIALKAQIEKLQESLGREMETIVQSQTESTNPIHQSQLQEALALRAAITADEAGREALTAQIARFDAKLAALPDKEMELARLERDRKSAEAIYTLLVTKKSEMEITEHMRTADVRLIDPAYLPPKDDPVKPRTMLNVAVALFLGLFAGAGAAFLLEYLDPSIKTRDEAVAALGLPVFGMIPDHEVFHENERDRRRRRHRSSARAAAGRIM